jgi:hypothetical protein
MYNVANPEIVGAGREVEKREDWEQVESAGSTETPMRQVRSWSQTGVAKGKQGRKGQRCSDTQSLTGTTKTRLRKEDEE